VRKPAATERNRSSGSYTHNGKHSPPGLRSYNEVNYYTANRQPFEIARAQRLFVVRELCAGCERGRII
jgi:hypothetical protein